MRFTVSLPDDLGLLVRNEARRRGISLSAVVRQSLETSLRKSSRARLPWQGIVSDPGSDARSVDVWLAENWADRVRGDPRR